jgi:hypothetical protein
VSYAATLATWHDFYVAVAAAAATLVGLLFVGLSLQLQTVVSRPDVRALARATLSAFGLLLVFSLFLLTPEVGAGTHGYELIGTAAIGGIAHLRSMGGALHVDGVRAIGVRQLVQRYGLYTACYAMVAAAGGLLLAGDLTDGLEWTVPAAILAVVVSLRNTWDLLVTVEQARAASRAQDSSAATSSS